MGQIVHGYYDLCKDYSNRTVSSGQSS
jgi:hypothetical protein